VTRIRGPACAVALLIFGMTAAGAEDLPTYKLTAENGRFSPETIEVPAGTRFRLEITNRNVGAEEFESADLRKELVLAPGVTRRLVFAPLKPGEYSFVGEFHPETARGRIIAK
jgi:plastocyanin